MSSEDPSEFGRLWRNAIGNNSQGGQGVDGIDNYDIDPAKVRELHLTYQGRDDAGNRYWTDPNGWVYNAVHIRKSSTDDPAGDTSESGGIPKGEADDEDLPSPANIPAADDTFNKPADSTPVFDNIPKVLNQATTDNINDVANLPSGIEQPWNKDLDDDDKDHWESYLYIVGVDGYVDVPAKGLFDMVNSLCSDVLYHMPGSGQVYFLQGCGLGDVGTSDTTSPLSVVFDK